MPRLFLVLLVLLVAGCARQPDEAQLRSEVEARVAAALPADTVEIAAFRRHGSQRDATAPVGVARRLLYYDVDLRVRRAYDFGAWDATGVAGLITALGAGPRGLAGVKPGGNGAGDIIRAHGTLLFERTGARWQAVAPQGYEPAPAPALATGSPASVSDRLIAAIRQTMAGAPPEASASVHAALEEELRDAYAAVSARIARFERGYAIAAGPEGGQYLSLVQAYAQDARSRVVALVTAGGEENLRLLREELVDLGLSQGDAALDAYRGEGQFAGVGPDPRLRVVGSLYPEVVHAIVRADSGIESFAGLRGKRLAVGPAGSAARWTAMNVLAAHGMAAHDLDLRELPLNAALVALRAREIDGIVTVIGIPADSIRVALAAVPLRLLALDGSAVESLTAGNPAYDPFILPAATYTEGAPEISTIATPAMLLIRGDLGNAEVRALTRLIFAPQTDLLGRGSSQGIRISARHAGPGLPIPQHEAAMSALAELVATETSR
jgi:TRAP transporter TAXI family solute receptor